MRVVWLLVFAGCYAASPAAGVPCDPARPACPSGQTCVARGGEYVCDTGRSDIDAPISTLPDADSDGIPDLVDNCPTMSNPTQANEDHDGFGNACDDCPAFPSTGIDADHDGVGDPCDPHPLVDGDAITLFEGFDGPLPPGWTATGTWAPAGGSLISVAINMDLSTMVIPYTSTTNQTISSAATVIALTGDTGGSIGIVDRFDGNAGLVCGAGRASAPLFGTIDAATSSFRSSKPAAFDTGSTYPLTFTRKDKAYDCATSTIDVQDMFNNANAGAKIGFRNRVATVSYDWIMVVKSP